MYQFLSEESYWAEGRPRETMDGLIDRAARNVGLYAPDGCADRLLPHRRRPDAFLVYLADVFVLPEHRGHGLGVELVRLTVDEGPYAHAALGPAHRRDAHELYEQFGFAPGERLLERAAPSGS